MKKLRPHHGLCTLFFEGKGYSEPFVRHMETVLREASTGARFCLTTEADEICAHCPNRRGNQCNSPKALDYDRQVLRRIGLSEGDTVTLPDLQHLVEKRILRPGQLEAVCGGCHWAPICRVKWNEWCQEP